MLFQVTGPEKGLAMNEAEFVNQPYLKPLYIIILNWKLADETISCIESLQQGDLTDVHLVVVDNNSADGSVEQLKARFATQIHLIENPDNFGFAAGVNVGIEYALKSGAQAVMLLNNDTIVSPQMIDELLQAGQQLPRAGLIGPAIYYHQAPDRIWQYGDKSIPWLAFPRHISQKEVETVAHIPFQLDYVTACCVVIRREVFETIGLFDPRFFMYFEDADFCARAKAAGFEIWCIPSAKVWHKVSLSAKKDKPTNRYAQAWGRVQFYRSNPLIARFPLIIYFILKLTWTSLRDIISGDWDLLKPLWLGTWNGYRDPLPLSPKPWHP